MNKKEERLGQINKNKNGTEYKLIQYNGANDIVVEFQDNYIYKAHTSYYSFKNGTISNPYDKDKYGVAYIGYGKYKSQINNISTPQYKSWTSLISRCYSDRELKRFPTYIDCIVCDEWLNFQNYAKWYDENYYEIPNCIMRLDKDILIKGNKLYSPNTCIFVPEDINKLFIKSNNNRGKFPIGVDFNKAFNKFRARCSNNICSNSKSVYIGSFDNVIDAFDAYKKYKENLIFQMAEKYKQYIPEKLYNAMLNYRVEIND